MHLRALLPAIFIASLACSASRPVNASGKTAERCSTAAKLFDGGAFHRASDGVDVWFKLAGKPGAPVLAFLHGGPGYNAHAFEKSGGRLLEQHFQVLYLDQRGCGRSGFVGAPAQYGMPRTIADVEELRARVGAGKLILAGHSFGGVVAAEYAHRYPEHTAALVMIDTTVDVARALQHQVDFTASVASEKFPDKAPEIEAAATAPGVSFARLGRLYDLIGRLPLQRVLHYADPANQDRMEAIDEASGILGCTTAEVVRAFKREGYLGGPVPTVARKQDVPVLALAGRASQIIGKENIEDSARTWGARVEWLDAGHFVYFEQPEDFASAIVAFARENALLQR